MLYDIGKTGFMSRRALPLIASDREHVVTLHPELLIAGRADRCRDRPALPKFPIIKASVLLGTIRSPGFARGDGLYPEGSTPPRLTSRTMPCMSGSRPSATNPQFRVPSAPKKGAQRFDFAMECAETLAGIVLLPDGKPADGVDVVLATEEDQVFFQGGHLENRTNASRSKTSRDGRFAFTVPKGSFRAHRH